MINDLYSQLYACLSPLVSGRAFPDTIPQSNKIYPAIRFSSPFSTPGDDSCGMTDIDGFSIQIDIYSFEHDPDKARYLREPTIVAVQNAFAAAERTGEFSGFEDDSRLHRWTLEFLIWFDN